MLKLYATLLGSVVTIEIVNTIFIELCYLTDYFK